MSSHHPLVKDKELSALTDYYLSNSFFYILVNTSLILIDYFTTTWWSFLYVFCWPIFAILMLAEEWDLESLKYNEELHTIGVEWL